MGVNDCNDGLCGKVPENETASLTASAVIADDYREVSYESQVQWLTY